MDFRKMEQRTGVRPAWTRQRCALRLWFAMVLPADFRFVLIFRMVRFFKIARYSPAMRSLLDVLYNERRALFGCLVITLGTALVTAALMHLAEGKVQPDKLGTIPDALWWSIVTVGTIVGVEGEDEDRRLSVTFPGRGTKKFIGRYAQLQQL